MRVTSINDGFNDWGPWECVELNCAFLYDDFLQDRALTRVYVWCRQVYDSAERFQ